MSRVYAFLRSDEAILLFLVLALVAQVPHAADVFHRITPYASEVCDPLALSIGGCLAWGHAFAYAIALESAILIFVMRGKMGLSWGFAVVSVLVNVGYYWGKGWSLDAITADMLRAALVSFALPGAIAFYSHEVGDKHAKEASSEAPMPEPPEAWVAILVDAVLDAIEKEMGEVSEASEEVLMPEPVPPVPMPATHQGICYASECQEPGEPCKRCGHPVCPKHTGTHKRWHCAPVVHANGHAKEAV